MAIYRSCVCLELNKLKSPLKCRRVVHRHPRVIIAGVLLSGQSRRLGITGLKAPTSLVLLQHASFCVKDAASCVCDHLVKKLWKKIDFLQKRCDFSGEGENTPILTMCKIYNINNNKTSDV